MARGLNRVMLIGFVEQSPVMRQSLQGHPFTSFHISVGRQWINTNGKAHTAVEWFNVVAWRDLAIAAAQHLEAGRRVYAEGSLQTRTWEEASGQQNCFTEIVATKVVPMDTRSIEPDAIALNGRRPMHLYLNRAMVIGNLGRDAEMRHAPKGHAVTFFSLAATCRCLSSQGERHTATEWFNVVSWGSLAEICGQHLTKGRRVYVEGELCTKGWELLDGRKLFRTRLVAQEMIILGPRLSPDIMECGTTRQFQEPIQPTGSPLE